MSEETQVLEVSEADLKEARDIGWADKDKWRGKAEDWVDAKTFLERGRQVLPIVTAHNRKLKGDLEGMGSQLVETQNALKAAQAAIAALEESHNADTAAQVEAARKQLKSELEAASRDGDHAAVADLTDQMTRLNAADDKGGKTDKAVVKDDASGDGEKLHPEVKAWFEEHPDFVKDRRRIALARAVADEMRGAGDRRVGSAFLDDVADEVERVIGRNGGSDGTSRVSGGNGGTGRRDTTTGGAKTYADLPADAKAVCDKQAAKLVGPTRAHKDLKSWQASYARQYFQE